MFFNLICSLKEGTSDNPRVSHIMSTTNVSLDAIVNELNGELTKYYQSLNLFYEFQTPEFSDDLEKNTRFKGNVYQSDKKVFSEIDSEVVLLPRLAKELFDKYQLDTLDSKNIIKQVSIPEDLKNSRYFQLHFIPKLQNGITRDDHVGFYYFLPDEFTQVNP